MEIIEKLALDSLNVLNPLIKDYNQGSEKTSHLTQFLPKKKAVNDVIKAKKDFRFRKELHAILSKQYKDITLSSTAKNNLNSLLQENTFTVTTAHQLCLFTGPSYFIYKILSAIKLAKNLSDSFTENNFVPIYWMGDEDHDFEEINHCNIYGKTITWENTENGAVGNMSLNGLDNAIAQLEDILGEKEEEKAFIAELKHFFTNRDVSYGKAFQEWIMHLFSAHGLLVLSQDDTELKKIISPLIKDEVNNLSAFNSSSKVRGFLEENYHVQATPRDINLFYLTQEKRERIEVHKDGFILVDSEQKISKEDMLTILEKHPERLSPNVILRPIYQEAVLPNVAFIGGPGELAYWLELKDTFKHFKLSQPLILLRDMAVILGKRDLNKLNDWNFTVADLFNNYDTLAKSLVKQFSENELNLTTEKETIEQLFNTIKNKVTQIDKTLEKSVLAEAQKVINSFENLEQKIIRAEKRQHDTLLLQLEKLKEKLFPKNILQERFDNFIPIYLRFGPDYFDDVLKEFDAFDTSMKVFSY